MDIWNIFMLFFLTFLIMSCCGYCCTTKRRGVVLSTPVVVTSTSRTVPGGYSVSQMPPQGFQPNVYAAPYPTQSNVNVQMPMPVSHQHMIITQPGFAPNPMPQAAMPTMNPPSYDVAVCGPSLSQSSSTNYHKQAPYNPNYPAH